MSETFSPSARRASAPFASASRDDWAKLISSAPTLDASLEAGAGCVIRHWKGTDPDVTQPSLGDHYVVLHLGGPKRVHRRADGPTLVSDIDLEGVSIVPSGASYAWRTEGPIEYAHIYVPPERLAWAAETLFDRDGGSVRLIERVGDPDLLLAAQFGALLESARSNFSEGLYAEVMVDAFLGRLLSRHTNLNAQTRPAQYALAPRRLAEVIAYVEERLASEITLCDLAQVARLSRFHFSRAFKRATGETPHAFVLARRVTAAKAKLHNGSQSLAEIARTCGFSSASHLSRRFLEAEGVRPGAYRRNL